MPDFLEEVLCQCDKLDVPVMLDFAYINIAKDLDIDVSHSCIKYIVSSLSKTFLSKLTELASGFKEKMGKISYT